MSDQHRPNIALKHFTGNTIEAQLTSWYPSLAPEYAFLLCKALLVHSNSSLMGVVTDWSFSSKTLNNPPPPFSCCPYHPLLSTPLLFLSLCWGCLFSLSIDLHSSTMSVMERSSVLLRCSVNPPCKFKQQKSSVSGRFLYFPVKVFLHFEPIFIISNSENWMQV